MKKDDQLLGIDLTWKEQKAIIMAMYSTILPIAAVFFITFFLAFVFIDYLWL